jgi:hypothetical protein
VFEVCPRHRTPAIRFDDEISVPHHNKQNTRRFIHSTQRFIYSTMVLALRWTRTLLPLLALTSTTRAFAPSAFSKHHSFVLKMTMSTNEAKSPPSNFAAATSRAGERIFGSCRPGGTADGLYAPASITADLIEDWVDLVVKQNGVKHVVSLMKEEELSWYDAPGYVDMLRASGVEHVTLIPDLSAEGATTKIREALEQAADEKILFHCVGGVHRTGNTLAFAASVAHGLTAEQACAEVEAQSASAGVDRHASVEKVQALLK